MFNFFGTKKEKPATKVAGFSSKDTFLSDKSRIEGDIEIHSFNSPLVSIEHSFYFTDARGNKANSTKVSLDPINILNEKVIKELMEKYPLVEHEAQSEDNEEVKEVGEINPSNVKLIRESLSLVVRYNNRRSYDERQGFASTLSDRAEEIGANNTIKFFLNIIDTQLVILY